MKILKRPGIQFYYYNKVENIFILRTPLLSLNNLISTEQELLNAYDDLHIREALFVASRDLYLELINFSQITDEAKRQKILVSLYKYYTRMCTRCTPFGLFSGINIGKWTDENNIQIKEFGIAKVRLDMDYLCNLYYLLNQKEEIFQKLVFYPNNSLYRVGNQWRYVEYQFKKAVRYHNLVSIDDNDLISEIIETAKEGVSYSSILGQILQFGFNEQESKQYLHQLINSQVLTTNLYPTVTGCDYQTRLFDELIRLEIEPFAEVAKKVDLTLTENQDLISKAASVEKYLRALPVSIDSNKLLQVDLLKDSIACTLDKRIKNRITDAATILLKLQITNKGSTSFDKFKMAFYERYEDKFIPLTRALDTDIGILYKNAISIAHANISDPRDKKIKSFKLGLYRKALKSGLDTLTITDSDIQEFKDDRVQILPPTYSFLGSVLQKESQIYIRYKIASGGSAINLLARFGYMHDDIENLLTEIAKEEQQYYKDATLAEIVHLPQGRLGNVVARPQLRDFEIPYLSHSTLPTSNQLNVDDLYIGVVSNRIVLYSKKLKKEIVPRLGNAHNYSHDGLPIYHFLADLQHQGYAGGVFWSWGELQDQPFLPRIMYKNVILTPKKWNVKTEHLRSHLKNKHSEEIRNQVFALGLPSRFLIIEADNELFIDLKSPIGLSTFSNYCSKRDSLVIEEFLFDTFSPLGAYSNEVIVPFQGRDKVELPVINFDKNVNLETSIRETFTPLSEWIYFKIYTGKQFIGTILLDLIPALLKELKDNNVIEKWFFVRFADPQDHLRIRFLIGDEQQGTTLRQIVNEFFAGLIDDGLVWDLQIATYKREVNRYGIGTMSLCETWFYYNSELVLDVLELFQHLAEGETITFLPYFIDSILAQFKLTSQEKMQFSKRYSEAFLREFGLDRNKYERNKLNDLYRTEQAKIARLFDDTAVLPPSIESVKKVFIQFIHSTNILVNDIVAKDNNDRLEQIINSFIHMFVNRLFNSNQRQSEMKGYYFLNKIYESALARSKNVERIL